MNATQSANKSPRKRLWGDLSAFAQNPLEFLTRTADESGAVAHLRFGRTKALLLSEPSLIEEVLVRKRLSFIKARALRSQKGLFGNGLILNEGQPWARQRRFAQPAFHPGNIGKHVPMIVERVSRVLDSWAIRETVDVHVELNRLLMGIAAEALFGPVVAPRAAEIGEAVEAAMDRFSARRGAARFLPEWMPFGDTRRFSEGAASISSFVEETIQTRLRAGARKDDLLGDLLSARDEDGHGMSTELLRDEAITLFVGAFDTPSLALAWAWYLLARHPRAAELLHSEVDSVIGNRAPVADDVASLRFAQNVVKESMRLYPPAWVLGREAVEDVQIGGISIRQRTVVLISQWVMHRDARFFSEPGEFRPERWTADGPPRFAYLPFGAGPRVCIGASFASLECTLALAMIAQRFHFHMETDAPVLPRPSMTLRPMGGMPAKLVCR